VGEKYTLDLGGAAPRAIDLHIRIDGYSPVKIDYRHQNHQERKQYLLWEAADGKKRPLAPQELIDALLLLEITRTYRAVILKPDPAEKKNASRMKSVVQFMRPHAAGLHASAQGLVKKLTGLEGENVTSKHGGGQGIPVRLSPGPSGDDGRLYWMRECS
jgi:hypothetical protein